MNLFNLPFVPTIQSEAEHALYLKVKRRKGRRVERRQQSQTNSNAKRKATQKTWIASAQLWGSLLVHSGSISHRTLAQLTN